MPLLIILYLGFASGLPLLLTLSTLSAWLAETGLSIQTIGLFGLVGIPYSLKFLWAPCKDAAQLPFLGRRLGHRRAWLLVTQLALVLALLAMAQIDPRTHLFSLAAAALLVAFLSASQDIIIDAYRIELQQQQPRLLGYGAAMQSLGYRLGLVLAGAGSLYLATYFSVGQDINAAWQDTYRVMAGVMAVLMAAVFFLPKTRHETDGAARPDLRQAVIQPLVEFWRRPMAGWILAFILLFKLGDALATSLATPFYLELQFSKIEIANFTKILGPAIFLLGCFIGAELVRRIGIMRGLWLGGIVQLLSNFMFAALAARGYDLTFLTLTIAAENFTSGLGSVAFVAYLSALCHVRYTLSQFALLSSLMAAGRTVLTAYSGFLVAGMGWFWFFIFTAVAAVPGMILLWVLLRRAPLDKDDPAYRLSTLDEA